MSGIIGRGRNARWAYPPGSPPTFGIPNEIIRYAFELTTGMAGTSQNPVSNQVGATPQDVSSPTNFAALLFAVPGGHLDLGDLVVLNAGGNTGSPIDFQYTLATITDPFPSPDGSLKAGVIDPTADGVISSQIDFTDVVIPAGGGIVNLQVIIPGDLNVTSAIFVSLSVGVLWNPDTILDPPA